jgi:putative nucleotidyltransferase with HDIG domain
VFSRFDSEKLPGFPIEILWKHSLATGLLARRIASAESGDVAVVEAAFTAGVLHDIGKLVLACSLPEPYAAVMERATARSLPQWKVETELIGASHAEVGAYLLGLWGLPASIVEAVAWHHQPQLQDPREFGALAAVHMADVIQSRETPSSLAALPASTDREYLESLKLDHPLGTWENSEARM